MNDETRADLVEELTQAQHDAWPGLDADFIVNTEAIMPIIDRLLADRAATVAEPDADAVEAAAKAIYDLAPAGLPSPSAVILGNLVTRLRELMPNKLITAFSFGNYIPYMGATVFNSLDYMHPNYGCNPTPPSGLPNSKWAKLSVHIQSQSSTNPTCSTMGVCANNYTGYGEVMMFNLREWDASSKMNCFASRLWGRTVCWTGTSHYKNYP